VAAGYAAAVRQLLAAVRQLLAAVRQLLAAVAHCVLPVVQGACRATVAII